MIDADSIPAVKAGHGLAGFGKRYCQRKETAGHIRLPEDDEPRHDLENFVSASVSVPLFYCIVPAYGFPFAAA